MLKKRKEVAQQSANRLFGTVCTIADAIPKIAKLARYIPVARSSVNSSAVVEEDAKTQAAQTLTALVDARGQIVETYLKLTNAKDQIGLSEMAVGGKDDNPVFAQGPKTLELVEKAA